MRPRLRGVSHRFACIAAAGCGVVLVLCARDADAAAASAVFGALCVGMFGTSALLHGADWPPRTFGWLRRADHAMINAFIAGTYTPLSLIGVGGETGTRLCLLSWSAAAVGILRAVLWPHAPRAITTGLYIAVGWVMVAYMPAVHAAFEPAAFALVMAGGVAYTIGAVVYAARWPDPSPAVFGYHEVFHVLIIAGVACHFVAVALVVTR